MITVVKGTVETIPRGLVRGLLDLKIRGQVETTNHGVIKIDRNTMKIPVDLKRLTDTETSVKGHQLKLEQKEKKTLKE